MSALHLDWFWQVLEGFLLGLLALVLHEAGHAVAAYAVGLKVKRFGVDWKGVYMQRESGPPAKNLVVSAAGPLTNLLLTLTWFWFPMFGLANLCFTAFNILPIQSSDGERVLRCWRQMRRPAIPRASQPEKRQPGKADAGAKPLERRPVREQSL